MKDPEFLDQADRLLGRFDFASQMAIKEETHRRHIRAMLLSFVDVMDSFERLFSGLGEAEPMTADQARQCMKSCRLIGRQLDQALRQAGVTELPSLTQPAEPGLHEIVGSRPAPGVEDGVIVEEVFRGYGWDGEILRKPRVIVSRNAD